MYRLYSILLSFTVLILFSFSSKADNPEFEQRRAEYIQNAITNVNSDAITIQAYKGVPVDSFQLTTTLNNISSKSTSDFDIVKLIRVLFLSNGQYDSQILPVLEPIPFWLTKNESLREYWSENHMIMWMSSDWLLHEKYGKEIDSTLEKRLRHYLKIKNQYGFYEFFSTTYAPFCLAGLLNLADFAQDAEIKNLATTASQRVLKEILLLTNDQGSLYPVAGRNYYSKYDEPFLQNHNHLIYLLTGFGKKPTSASHSAGFLASSSIDIDDVISSWKPVLNIVYPIGHTLLDGINNINKDMAQNDKVIFQWSSGGYFHPDVAASTFQLLKDYNLWDHFEFDEYKQFSGLPTNWATSIANLGGAISKSSVICGQNVAIFKNKSVTLSSILDFWKGLNGYQQFPVVANLGTSAVFTITGTPSTDWSDRPSHHANSHLPYVMQKDNVALVMYRPDKGLGIFGYKDEKLDVALHFRTEKMDEVRENGKWILGREKDGYVAVRRSCTGEINGVHACNNPDGQTWVIMVGNKDMYSSFEQFEQVIQQSQFEEKWYFNLPTLQWVYYSKIVVDGKTLEYAWNGDIFSGPTQAPTSVKNLLGNNNLTVYPNPSKNEFNIDFSGIKLSSTLSIRNILGQEFYNAKIAPLSQLKQINTETWPTGMYYITVETEEGIFTQKILIEK